MTTCTPTDVRLHLLERGFCPLPLQGKSPDYEINGKGWQQKRRQTNADEIKLWETMWPAAANTGVLCQLTPFLDIDILNPDAAQAVEDLVAERFNGHTLLTRLSRPNAPSRSRPTRRSPRSARR
jgi:hypothetical protein